MPHGIDYMNATDKDIREFESMKGQSVKQRLGLSKRSHYTQLLQALYVQRIDDIIVSKVLSLFPRILKVPSASCKVCMFHLS